MKEILKLIADKAMSGRWFLTVVGGLVFGFVAIKKILPPEATSAILTAIFTSYFSRTDRTKKEDGK